MPEDPIKTADTIRILRLQRAWSQEQLAGIAGISARTVQRLEQGQSAALESLKALAAAFDIPVSRLREGQTPLAKDDAMTDSLANPAPRDPVRIFRRHLLAFTGVMSGLALINLLHSPEHPWVIYPAMGWGIPLAIKALSLRRSTPPAMG